MIKVKHPDPECNKKQEERLQNALEEERRFHELLFTVGNITYRYHQRAKEFHPTQLDWQEWLEGLPENLRKDMEQKGFQQGRQVLSFTRYVMKKMISG